MDIKKILDEYRTGDEGKRVSLFLAFRDLRDYFSYIDDQNPVDLTFFTFPRLPWKKIEDQVHASWLHFREHFSRKPCRAH
jgi:hypothetical protein